MRIAVAGGTGVVGRHVVDVAARRGHDVVVLSRSAGVDLTSGDGVAERLDGVDALIDVSGVRTQSRRAAREFFGSATRHLLQAGAVAGVAHHVTLSIVGVDLVNTGYYSAKCYQEELLRQGPVPWSLLRSTQFHEFAEQALQFAVVGPVAVVPRMRVQPVAALEVAEALLDAVQQGPRERLPDLAGPQAHDLVDLARRVAHARHPGLRVLGIPVPGAAGRAMRSGALLPSTASHRGRVTFRQWLEQPE